MVQPPFYRECPGSSSLETEYNCSLPEEDWFYTLNDLQKMEGWQQRHCNSMLPSGSRLMLFVG